MLTLSKARSELVEYCTGNAKHDENEEQHENLRVGELVDCGSLKEGKAFSDLDS